MNLATTTIPIPVVAVLVFSLAASGICLIFAIVFAFTDRNAKEAVRKAAEDASSNASAHVANPAVPQAGVDFAGLAQLAEALAKLNQTSTFLIMSLAFAAVAAVAGGAGAVADAVAK